MARHAAPTRLPYGRAPSQHGDLRHPGTASPPVVVLLHGGFWRAAYGLHDLDDVAATLTAELGVATWNVEYRRVGEAGGGWPGTFDDVAAAIDHVPALAAAHGLDGARVAVAGFSAGGHLALWAAARAGGRLSSADTELAEATRAPGPRLRGVIALAPVSDLDVAADVEMNRGIVAELMGGAPDAVPARYTAGSPTRLLPTGVRQVLVHGEDDDLVPEPMSRVYVQRAQSLGDPATLVAVEGAGHFELVDPASAAWPAVRDAIAGVLA